MSGVCTCEHEFGTTVVNGIPVCEYCGGEVKGPRIAKPTAKKKTTTDKQGG